MNEKVKKINLSSIATIIKTSLIAVVVSILLVLVFAFVLKFVDLNSGVISLVDQIIKILSIFVAVIILNKSVDKGLLLNGLIVGAIYAIMTFIVFSILNGGFNITPAIFSDIAFSAIVGAVSAMLINIFAKK